MNKEKDLTSTHKSFIIGCKMAKPLREIVPLTEARLHNAMKAMLGMPYYKNEAARSGKVKYSHQGAIANRLIKQGFTKHEKHPKISTKHVNDLTEKGRSSDLNKTLKGMPKNSFIHQPRGSQSFPDFIVKDHKSRLRAIEAKSGAGGSPIWNNNVPKPHAIYVFSSAKHNKTTAFMGKDVISTKQRDILNRQVKAEKALHQGFRKEMATADKYNRGFIERPRTQYWQQQGPDRKERGFSKVDFIRHPDRKRCQGNVLKYVK